MLDAEKIEERRGCLTIDYTSKHVSIHHLVLTCWAWGSHVVSASSIILCFTLFTTENNRFGVPVKPMYCMYWRQKRFYLSILAQKRHQFCRSLSCHFWGGRSMVLSIGLTTYRYVRKDIIILFSYEFEIFLSIRKIYRIISRRITALGQFILVVKSHEINDQTGGGWKPEK